MKMEGSDEDKYTALPIVGQHNDEILKGLLKYSDDQIARMREEEQRHALELIARLQKTDGDAAIRVLEKEAERQKQDDWTKAHSHFEFIPQNMVKLGECNP